MCIQWSNWNWVFERAIVFISCCYSLIASSIFHLENVCTSAISSLWIAQQQQQNPNTIVSNWKSPFPAGYLYRYDRECLDSFYKMWYEFFFHFIFYFHRWMVRLIEQENSNRYSSPVALSRSLSFSIIHDTTFSTDSCVTITYKFLK